MNDTVTWMANDAEKALAQGFARRLPELAGSQAIADFRAGAFEQFERTGLPTRRVEAWHYSDLRSVMREVFPVAERPGAAALETAHAELAKLPAGNVRVVIVDGFYQPELGTPGAGITVTDLETALARGDAGLVADIAPGHGQGPDGALALNAALMSGGAIIDIQAAAEPDLPLEIVSIVTGHADAAVFSRSLVRAGVGSKAVIVERHVVAGNARVQKNDALIVRVQPEADVSHVFVSHGQGDALLQINSLMADVGAKARFSSFGLLDTGAFVRRQIFASFSGAHALLELSGLALIRGKDHCDTTLVVEHVHPACASKEYFKHIVDGAGAGVFQGKVSVAPQAQKTDGAMKSRTILLSDDAAMYNKPELEIFADDVACGHGATCGSLDPNQLFYAMARGLPRREAETLLLEAFGADAMEQIPGEGLKVELQARLRQWLDTRTA